MCKRNARSCEKICISNFFELFSVAYVVNAMHALMIVLRIAIKQEIFARTNRAVNEPTSISHSKQSLAKIKSIDIRIKKNQSIQIYKPNQRPPDKISLAQLLCAPFPPRIPPLALCPSRSLSPGEQWVISRSTHTPRQ